MFGTFANAAARLAHACGPFDFGQVWKQADTRELYRIVRQGTGAQCWELQYEDEGNTSPYTDEQAQDAVAATLTDSDTIEFLYFDAIPRIQANVINDSIAFAKMQEIATDRLIGRDTAGTGNPEEISVSGGLEFDGSQNIRRSALTGDVTASAGSNATTIANGAVTLAKMADIATDRLIGRDTAGTGAPEAISLDDTLEFNGSGSLQRAALTGDVTASAGSNSTSIPNGSLGNAKLANMAESTIKGRAAGGGTGAPSDLTAAQVHAILATHQTLDASTSTVTYNVQNGLHASVTLSSGVSATFTLNFTNLVAGMRGSLRVDTTGTVNFANIQVAGVNGALIPSGDLGALLSDSDVAVLEWFYTGTLIVWRDTTALNNYAA